MHADAQQNFQIFWVGLQLHSRGIILIYFLSIFIIFNMLLSKTKTYFNYVSSSSDPRIGSPGLEKSEVDVDTWWCFILLKRRLWRNFNILINLLAFFVCNFEQKCLRLEAKKPYNFNKNSKQLEITKNCAKV